MCNNTARTQYREVYIHNVVWVEKGIIIIIVVSYIKGSSSEVLIHPTSNFSCGPSYLFSSRICDQVGMHPTRVLLTSSGYTLPDDLRLYPIQVFAVQSPPKLPQKVSCKTRWLSVISAWCGEEGESWPVAYMSSSTLCSICDRFCQMLSIWAR